MFGSELPAVTYHTLFLSFFAKFLLHINKKPADASIRQLVAFE